MAYDHTASSAMPVDTLPNHDAARGQRTIQIQFIEERLRNDISPAAVAGITIIFAQLETQPTLPSLAVSIVADEAAYKRTMTYRNGVWDGYDLTQLFLDDRSTVERGPSVHTTLEQEATLRIAVSNVPVPQPLPPAHLVIQPEVQATPQPQPQPIYLPSVQPMEPPSTSVTPHVAPYSSAPTAKAPHMILQTTSSTSNRELAGSAPVKFPAPGYSQLSFRRHLQLAPSLHQTWHTGHRVSKLLSKPYEPLPIIRNPETSWTLCSADFRAYKFYLTHLCSLRAA